MFFQLNIGVGSQVIERLILWAIITMCKKENFTENTGCIIFINYKFSYSQKNNNSAHSFILLRYVRLQYILDNKMDTLHRLLI